MRNSTDHGIILTTRYKCLKTLSKVDNIQETFQLLSGCNNFKPAPVALHKHLKPSVVASRSSSNCTMTLLKGRGNVDMSLCIADDEGFFLDEVKEKVYLIFQNKDSQKTVTFHKLAHEIHFKCQIL